MFTKEPTNRNETFDLGTDAHGYTIRVSINPRRSTPRRAAWRVVAVPPATRLDLPLHVMAEECRFADAMKFVKYAV
jgi:hypothetical protein